MYAAKIFAVAAVVAFCLSAATVNAAEPANGGVQSRFDYLSTHGNSSCAQSFMSSIAAMPAGARLQAPVAARWCSTVTPGSSRG